MRKFTTLSFLTFILLIVPMHLSAERTLTVSAGNLKKLFVDYELQYESNLTLKGTINGSDVKVLREWAGSHRALDLKDCRIVAGGEPYYESYTTEDDVIGSYMFYEKEFKSFVLPKTLKKIGDYAISFCGESIDFPPTLTWLGDHAFHYNNFERLHIPASLVHIGNGALNRNASLYQVTIDSNNPEFVLEDGYLYTRDHTRLLSYFCPIGTHVETLTIRPEVKIIDDEAFNIRCDSLNLNEGLEYIGERAFCAALKDAWKQKLIIPNSVTYIGPYAFEQCYVDTLIISDNVEYLAENVFACCFIEHIHLPAKLKGIDRGALSNSLKYNMELPNGLETVGPWAVNGLTKGTLVIPESVRQMDEFAFADINVVTLDIRAPLDSIPTAAFYSSEMLKKLILPPTIKRLGSSAFYECYCLVDCKLPDGLEVIEDWALAGADDMKEWHIPASVRKIGRAAFAVPNFTSHTVYMYSQEPPAETDPEAFLYWTMEESVLYVPTGCIERYKQKSPWNTFGEIREFAPTGIKYIPRTFDGKEHRSFDIGGRISNGQQGLHIELTPKGTRKIIKKAF